MKSMPLGSSSLMVPPIAVGCMRINGLSAPEAEHIIQMAMDLGANFFDHADIYGQGQCEEIFAKAVHMNASIRESIILQSKCGIVPGKMFDFSKEHIINSVDGILSRLQTDYLDVLLLHRPDALCEPDEVAAAFDCLHQSGKVRHFGISNHTPLQIELLQRSVKQPLIANQMQLSITNAMMITEGINANTMHESGINRDGDVLNYCRLHNITIQAWSPMQYGFFEGVFLGSDKYPELNEVINHLAVKYEVNPTTIAIAWILRHPAHMMPVTGTMNEGRLTDCIRAAEVSLTREEWYQIYLAAGHNLP